MKHCEYVRLYSNDQQDGTFGSILKSICRKCRKISEKILLKGNKASPSSDSTAKDSNSKDEPKSRCSREIERGHDGHFVRSIYYGWVLERTGWNASNYRLRNRTSHRVLDLPETKEKEWPNMLPVYLPSRKTFKMVFPFPNHKNGNLNFKILTVGIDKKWRDLDFPSTSKLTNTKLLVDALFDDAYVIAVLPEDSNGDNAATILYLGVESEKLWTIDVSRDFITNGTEDVAIVEWDGKIALARKLENDLLYVSVVENLKNQKWAKERIMVDLTYLKDARKYYTAICFRDNVLWMCRDLESYLSFDIVSKDVTYFSGLDEMGRKFCGDYPPYLEDLEGSKPIEE